MSKLMRRSARDHDRTGRRREAARLLAIALIATIAAAPVASSWHELTLQHVRCAEHGELTHVPTSQGFVVAVARAHASVGGQDLPAVDGHDHCSGGFIVRKKVDLSVIRSPVRWTPPPSVARETREPAPRPGRVSLLASAPKTSPPSA
jgi:hypothetical protein